jgi:hypothetical protein
MFSFFMSLPLPVANRYQRLSAELRERVAARIAECQETPEKYPAWCVLRVIKDEMSPQDQLEVGPI